MAPALTSTPCPKCSGTGVFLAHPGDFHLAYRNAVRERCSCATGQIVGRVRTDAEIEADEARKVAAQAQVAA